MICLYTPRPEPITGPVVVQDWEALTFLHWPVAPSALQRCVPRGLEIEQCGGVAWVGLVPFNMRISPGPIPPIPYATVFPETNVRTYVRGPDGRSAVFFLSLDIPRLAGVLFARASYRVPYMWSRMSVDVAGNRVTYRCRRRWGGPPAESKITIEPGDPYALSDLGDLDHFLTSRWGLYTRLYGRLAYAPLEHDPWPLARARIVDIHDTLVAATGISVGHGEPVVHYAAHMRARLGLPRYLDV